MDDDLQGIAPNTWSKGHLAALRRAEGAQVNAARARESLGSLTKAHRTNSEWDVPQSHPKRVDTIGSSIGTDDSGPSYHCIQMTQRLTVI